MEQSTESARMKSEKTATQILAEMQERIQKLQARDMRVVNICHVRREVSRIVQKIKDKSDNIHDLNRKRDFPLKKEEINDLLCHTASCLNKLDRYFFLLEYIQCGNTFDDDTIRRMKSFATSLPSPRIAPNDEEEISSLLTSMAFILREKNNTSFEVQRKISGLKKRIRNIQSNIMEALEYEDLDISMNWWKRDNLAQAAKPITEMNLQIRNIIQFDEASQEGQTA